MGRGQETSIVSSGAIERYLIGSTDDTGVQAGPRATFR